MSATAADAQVCCFYSKGIVSCRAFLSCAAARTLLAPPLLDERLLLWPAQVSACCRLCWYGLLHKAASLTCTSWQFICRGKMQLCRLGEKPKKTSQLLHSLWADFQTSSGNAILSGNFCTIQTFHLWQISQFSSLRAVQRVPRSDRNGNTRAYSLIGTQLGSSRRSVMYGCNRAPNFLHGRDIITCI